MHRPLRNGLVLVVLCLAIGGANFFAMRLDRRPDATTNRVDNFAYQLLDGRTGQLAAHADKMLVLHFWATWCVPCRTEIPALLQAAAAHRDVTFLLMSVDESAKTVGDFFHARPLPGNVVLALDSDRHVAAALKVSAFPESFILLPGLMLDRHLVGPVPWMDYPF